MPKLKKSKLKMPKLRIKKGDQVLILAGKDKGKKGEVIKVNTSSSRVIVEGINMFKKHIKNQPGVTNAGIVDKESPIHISNLMFIHPESYEPGRVAYEKLESGKYNRIVKKSNRK